MLFPSYVNTWSSERRKAFEIMYNHAVFGRDVSKGKIIVEGANPGQGKAPCLMELQFSRLINVKYDFDYK